MTNFLYKIPVIRGWLTRSKNSAFRKAQLTSYDHFMRAVKDTPIGSVLFSSDGCVYTLDDGRAYRFDPERSASWLYSVPSLGTFEKAETEYIKTAIREGWVCADIGGCFGWYSVLFSRLSGNGGEVHVFEPVPDNKSCLDENLELNNCQNVTVNDFALGREPSVERIFVPVDGVSGSLKAHAKLEQCKVLDIQVSTLDQYVADYGLSRLDFIKADIEGAELPMLQGAEETLRRFRPELMLEIQERSTTLFGYTPEDVFSFMGDIGYSGYIFTQSGDLEPCYPGCLAKHYNFIFRSEG